MNAVFVSQNFKSRASILFRFTNRSLEGFTTLGCVSVVVQNLVSRLTLAMPRFWKFLRDRVRTVPGNVEHVKFEVRSFNRF